MLLLFSLRLYFFFQLYILSESIIVDLSKSNGYSNDGGADVNRKELAARLYKDAFYYLQKEDHERALAVFRSVVRLDNSNYLYWNDLGVTEMRMGHLQKAYERFLRSSELNPQYELSQRNLEEIRNYVHNNPNYTEKRKQEILQVSPYRQRYPKDQKHSLKEIPTYSLEAFHNILQSLKSKTELKQFLSKPFLIKNYHTSWDAGYFAFEGLKQRFHSENKKVDFYPHNMLEEQTHPFYQTLNKALDEFLAPTEAYLRVDVSQPGSYLQWNLLPDLFQQIVRDIQLPIPSILDDAYLLQDNPHCFAGPSKHDLLQRFFINTHWKMLLLGEEGAGMFNHQDTLLSPTWQFLLQGVKQWHLCANHFTPFLYKPGEVNLFAPDYHWYPNLLKIKCYQFNQTAGDLLYYPGNYWHQTMNFETPTIGLTSTFIREESVESLIKELKNECVGANRLFAKDNFFCEELEKCFISWKALLNDDNERFGFAQIKNKPKTFPEL